jgi:drug/metabolite transporter (DMT)-like permease
MAVLYAALAGLQFGLLAVFVRIALRRGGDPEVGAIVVTGIGFLTALLLATHELTGEVDFHDLLPFYLSGLVVPGASQIIFILAIRDAGPARASVIIGVAPLLSVAIALIFLDERFEPLLVVATLLVVCGGAALALERTRPAHFRVIGAIFAFVCALMFGVRDNVVRWATQDVDPPPLLASAAALAGAATTVLVYLLVFRRARLRANLGAALQRFAPAGLVLGVSYAFLVLGFDNGRVSIVAPLNATQSLWGVVLSVVFLRQSEAVGKRLFVAAALVVAGSAIVGIVR